MTRSAHIASTRAVALAQEMKPRAYSRAPVGTQFVLFKLSGRHSFRCALLHGRRRLLQAANIRWQHGVCHRSSLTEIRFMLLRAEEVGDRQLLPKGKQS